MRPLLILLVLISSVFSQEITYEVPSPDISSPVGVDEENIFKGITLIYTTKLFKLHGFTTGYQGNKVGIAMGFCSQAKNNEWVQGNIVSISKLMDICVYLNTSIGPYLIKPTLGFSIEGHSYEINKTIDKKFGFSPTTGLRTCLGPIIFDSFYSWRYGGIYTGVGFIIPNKFFTH